MLLSVIVPCYNEEENVPIFYEEMMKNSAFLEQEKLELEIIYIDDGSKDNTGSEVRLFGSHVLSPHCRSPA